MLRRKQELQEIEKKQAMDKIAALKKTSVGAKALKDLTEEVTRLLSLIKAHFITLPKIFGMAWIKMERIPKILVWLG